MNQLQNLQKSKVGDETVPRILWISNSFNLNTGYAECVREFCNRLGTKFWITHVAQQQVGGPFKPEGFNFDVVSYVDGGVNLVQAYINKIKPDVVIIQDDSFTSVRDGLANIDYGKAKLIGYWPHDGELFANISKPIVDKCDVIVAMSNFGKKHIESEGYENVRVIYHGTDPTIFRPLNEAQKQDKRILIKNFIKSTTGVDAELENKFVVYSMGRNTLRKQFINLLRAWCKFAKGKDDVSLIINSIGFASQDQNMPDWIERGIPRMDGTPGDEIKKGKVVFFPAQSYARGFPQQMIADLTAMSDATLFAALGEGMGMGMLESFFCKVPVISHSFTTPEELVDKERGFLFGSTDWFVGGLGIPHLMPDTDDCVRALEEAYSLWKKGELKGHFDEGFDKFINEHTWDQKSDEWAKLINEVTGGKRRTD